MIKVTGFCLLYGYSVQQQFTLITGDACCELRTLVVISARYNEIPRCFQDGTYLSFKGGEHGNSITYPAGDMGPICLNYSREQLNENLFSGAPGHRSTDRPSEMESFSLPVS